MAKQICCPWFASDGFLKWCMNGHFPCNCETCDCHDKQWHEVKTTTTTTLVEFVNRAKDIAKK